mmetsp:Transcript_46548/g.115442  ORF Transcript_46548/g.115442 Transcript_46548/m.115442 type:complete len:116 (-) Transcript_46548:291-638(-)
MFSVRQTQLKNSKLRQLTEFTIHSAKACGVSALEEAPRPLFRLLRCLGTSNQEVAFRFLSNQLQDERVVLIELKCSSLESVSPTPRLLVTSFTRKVREDRAVLNTEEAPLPRLHE